MWKDTTTPDHQTCPFRITRNPNVCKYSIDLCQDCSIGVQLRFIKGGRCKTPFHLFHESVFRLVCFFLQGSDDVIVIPEIAAHLFLFSPHIFYYAGHPQCFKFSYFAFLYTQSWNISCESVILYNERSYAIHSTDINFLCTCTCTCGTYQSRNLSFNIGSPSRQK